MAPTNRNNAGQRNRQLRTQVMVPTTMRSTTPVIVKTTSKKYRKDKFSPLNTHSNPVYPRPEVKYIDANYGPPAIPVPNTGAGVVIAVLNSLNQGVGAGARIGNSVSVKSVYYQLCYNLGTTQAPLGLRMLVYWDRQLNASPPNINDLLVSAGNYITAPLNLDNRERFVVLADERIAMSPNSNQIQMVKGFRTINQSSTYSSAASAPTSGALLWLTISDEAVPDAIPTFTGNFRVRYIDN